MPAGPERCRGGHGARFSTAQHGSARFTAHGSRLRAQHSSREGGARARRAWLAGWLPFPGQATRRLRAGDPAPSEPSGPRRLGTQDPRFSFCHIAQALAHRRGCRRTGTPLQQSCAWESRSSLSCPGRIRGWAREVTGGCRPPLACPVGAAERAGGFRHMGTCSLFGK